MCLDMADKAGDARLSAALLGAGEGGRLGDADKFIDLVVNGSSGEALVSCFVPSAVLLGLPAVLLSTAMR